MSTLKIVKALRYQMKLKEYGYNVSLTEVLIMSMKSVKKPHVRKDGNGTKAYFRKEN